MLLYLRDHAQTIVARPDVGLPELIRSHLRATGEITPNEVVVLVRD